MSRLELEQRKIRKRMRRGGTLGEVESEVIDHSQLSLDQRAALWLYAWTRLPKRKQRAELARLNGFLLTES